MSYELIFVPRLLGQSWAEALDAAARAAELIEPALVAARLAGWSTLAPEAAALLQGAVEHHGHRHRELCHPASGLRLTLFGSDAVIALPYWHAAPTDAELLATVRRLAALVEEHTGLVGYDPQLGRGVHRLPPTDLIASYRRRRAGWQAALGLLPAGEPVPAGEPAPARDTASATDRTEGQERGEPGVHRRRRSSRSRQGARPPRTAAPVRGGRSR